MSTAPNGGSNGAANGTTNNALGEQLLHLASEVVGRGVFSANESDRGGPAHDQVCAWDYDHFAGGWNRPDYFGRFFGTVDGLASQDTNGDGTNDAMYFGTGNSNRNYNIARHEGAGIGLALKAKEFGPNGGDYSPDHVTVDANGVAHYTVDGGVSPDNPNRADWSVDFAATPLSSGADSAFAFKSRSTLIRPSARPSPSTTSPPCRTRTRCAFRPPGRQRAGLFWYHPHAHGFVTKQILGELSGGLVVDGSDQLYPILKDLPERLFLIKHTRRSARTTRSFRSMVSLIQWCRSVLGRCSSGASATSAPRSSSNSALKECRFSSCQPTVTRCHGRAR
jgi:hypothetical protein